MRGAVGDVCDAGRPIGTNYDLYSGGATTALHGPWIPRSVSGPECFLSIRPDIGGDHRRRAVVALNNVSVPIETIARTLLTPNPVPEELLVNHVDRDHAWPRHKKTANACTR